MPSGQAHFKIGLVGGAGLLMATAMYSPEDLRPVIVGSIAGLILTPDLDQERVKTFTEELLYQIHWVVGVAFETNWFPYGAAFKHRGASHWPIVGTAGRIGWLFVLLVFWSTVATGAQWYGNHNPTDWIQVIVLPIWHQISVPLLVAWFWQDALHIIADYVVSEIKSIW